MSCNVASINNEIQTNQNKLKKTKTQRYIAYQKVLGSTSGFEGSNSISTAKDSLFLQNSGFNICLYAQYIVCVFHFTRKHSGYLQSQHADQNLAKSIEQHYK